MFGLGEIVLGGQGQGLALNGGDALIALHVLALVDGHDEHALAQQQARARTDEAAVQGGDFLFVIAAIAAQQALGVVVGHHIGHGAVALGLDDQATFEFEAGAHQGGQDAGFAQQIGYWLGIGVALENLIDDFGQARDAPAHRPVLDLEGGGHVVGHEQAVRV